MAKIYQTGTWIKHVGIDYKLIKAVSRTPEGFTLWVAEDKNGERTHLYLR